MSQIVSGKHIAEMLREDHAKMKKLFEAYHATDDPAKKEDTTKKLSYLLRQHMSVEEQLFFPALKKVMPVDRLGEIAERQLEEANLLIDKLQRLYIEIDRNEYDSLMNDLNSCVVKHIDSEEKLLLEVSWTS